MLTHVRVNLSLMLSITTASYVKIMGNSSHRDGRVRTARGEVYYMNVYYTRIRCTYIICVRTYIVYTAARAREYENDFSKCPDDFIIFIFIILDAPN